MTTSRRARIEAMLVDEPQDIFLRYSLANELDKEGQSDAALSLYQQLQTGAAPYVPAYFQAAQMLARLERVEEARATLRSGIDVARTTGDAHAAGEMSEFLMGLGSHGE